MTEIMAFILTLWDLGSSMSTQLSRLQCQTQ
jgi:hypothetical protein